MANLTLAIDDELLKQARLKAVQEGTSINTVVREMLGRYVHGEPREQIAALDDFLSIVPPSTKPGKRRWKRSDLYDR